MFQVAPTLERTAYDLGLRYHVLNEQSVPVAFCFTQSQAEIIAACLSFRQDVERLTTKRG